MFLPYAHDRTVTGTQWVTIALIAINAAVFAWTWPADRSARAELARSVHHLGIVARSHPNARIPPSALDGMHPVLASILSRYAIPDVPRPDTGDEPLASAVADVRAAFESQSVIRWGYTPSAPTLVGLFASMFVHGDLEHLAGNMLLLWLAGVVIECFWGRWRYIALYVATGVAATYAEHLASPGSLAAGIGASGAIAGLLGAFWVTHSSTKVKAFYWILWRVGVVEVSAFVLIAAWVGLNLLYASLAPEAPVAWWAHVGGFVAGAAVGLVVLESRKVRAAV